MRGIREELADHKVLGDLPERYLELIAGCGENVHYDAGAVLFRAGRPAQRFYAIRHGQVALELHPPNKGPVVVDTVGAGDVLGWSWLFAPHWWSFDARATEATRAVSFDGRCLRDKAELDHELGYELMRVFGAVIITRLQATRLRLLDMYAPP